MTRRRRGLVAALVALALLAAACGDDDDGGAADDGVGNGGNGAVELTIAASGIAFDKDTLTVPAGAEVTLTFDNQDDGIPHNIHVLGTDGEEILTEAENGPVTQTLTFTIDEPGEYDYRCDVHPGDMAGTLVVEG